MIRKATVANSAALQALYAALNPKDPAVSAESFSQTLSVILSSGNNEILVYDLEEVLVSTCYLNITQNLSRNLRPYALIENVVTLAEHRQRGYGTAVLQAAMEEARSRGCYKVMLMTGSKRESTLRFYEKADLHAGQKTAFHTRLAYTRQVGSAGLARRGGSHFPVRLVRRRWLKVITLDTQIAQGYLFQQREVLDIRAVQVHLLLQDLQTLRVPSDSSYS